VSSARAGRKRLPHRRWWCCTAQVDPYQRHHGEDAMLSEPVAETLVIGESGVVTIMTMPVQNRQWLRRCRLSSQSRYHRN